MSAALRTKLTIKKKKKHLDRTFYDSIRNLYVMNRMHCEHDHIFADINMSYFIQLYGLKRRRQSYNVKKKINSKHLHVCTIYHHHDCYSYQNYCYTVSLLHYFFFFFFFLGPKSRQALAISLDILTTNSSAWKSILK